LLTVSGMAALSLALASCSGGGAKKSATVASRAEGVPGASGAAVAGGQVTAAGTPGGAAVPPAAPRIVRTGTISVGVARGNLSRAFDSAAAAASAGGGFVADSSTTTAGGTSSARLVLRIPVATFDAMVDTLGRLGSVEQKDFKGEDVTGQLVDLAARSQSLMAEESALRTLVGQAKTVGEVLQVQDQLFQVRQQIEQLAAQQSSLDDRATYATIEVRLTEAAAVAGRAGPRRGDPLQRAVRLARTNTAAVGRAALLTLGWSFPLLVLLGMMRLAWPILRRLRPSN
jgi:hypothetical protein